MKKIIIVNNNLDTGGIQRSLVNLVNNLCDEFDITVLLFAKVGSLIDEIDERVRIIYSSKTLSILGISREKLKTKNTLYLFKIFCKILNRIIGKNKTMDFMCLFQNMIEGYDIGISYSHCTPYNQLSICTPEFVLKRVNSSNKICFIHCDYRSSGTVSDYNNEIYRKFDAIACCSNGVKNSFLNVVPDLKDRCYTVRNFYLNNLIKKANENTFEYNASTINLITCARLSKEKGIERAISAIVDTARNDLRYYIVGDGPEKHNIERLIRDKNAEDYIFCLGNQTNPYSFMLKADYLVVPSYHEAAPMVYDEANVLGLRVITTETTSSYEMLCDEDIICENSYEGLLASLQFIIKPTRRKHSNLFTQQKKQFVQMIKSFS